MNYKNFLKGILLFISITVILSLINTTLYYNNILGTKIVQVLEIVTLLISTFISGFYIGIKSQNKAYINGIILGLIFILISLSITLFTKQELNLLSIITYLLLITVATTSSIIGINNKK